MRWRHVGLLPFVKSHASVALGLCVVVLVSMSITISQAENTELLIDDFSDPGLTSKIGTRWRSVSDTVMGGISQAEIAHDTINERNCLRLSGDVRLENNGGFIQAALDLAPENGSLDASRYDGIRLMVRGNGERYSVHLRTPDNVRPWQSYRAHFTAGSDWQTLELPFSMFLPYRLDVPLDKSRLRRIGFVAIGRAFHADLVIGKLTFYRQHTDQQTE